jgi:hypothetical protein
MYRMTLRLALLALLVTVAATSIPAQTVTTSVDSATAAGRLAAERAPVGKYITPAFLGGLTFGFFGPSLFTSEFESWKFASGVGLATVAVVATRASVENSAVPDSMTLRLETRDSVYVDAYTQSYTQTLTQRRQKGVATGAAFGTLAGLLGFVLMVRSIGT